MKRAIAVQEILRRILIVEDNGNLEEALTEVRKSYKKKGLYWTMPILFQIQ